VTVHNWPGVRIGVKGLQPEFAPRSAARRTLSLELANIMLELIWLHEFYHVVRGHLDFMEFAKVKPTLISAYGWLRRTQKRRERTSTYLFERHMPGELDNSIVPKLSRIRRGQSSNFRQNPGCRDRI
jgi:hypothetical protein